MRGGDMGENFRAVKVTEKVYWVGAIDWNIRDFHGYSTDRGTTYNAYLILSDKNVLMDTVKAPFFDEMIYRISSVIDPEKIDYIVSNHSEMDHSGSLVKTIGAVKPDKVFASKMGKAALTAHFHADVEGVVNEVKDGEVLELGDDTLTFMETRMLHWPDSMVSYLSGDSLLFSQDGFGMHLASSKRFGDEIEDSVLERESTKYYANILLPYSNLILKLIEKIKASGLDIKIIAPDHGPIWRKEPGKIVELYGKFAKMEPKNKAIVVYDTMWQSTAKMAAAIEDGLADSGTEAKVFSMGSNHRSDVVTEIIDAGALIVGSPTLNNNIFPTLADLLTYMKGLKPKNLIGQAFGSYGWSGESPKILQGLLADMEVELVGEMVRAQYVPTGDSLESCHALGKEVSKRLKAIAGK